MSSLPPPKQSKLKMDTFNKKETKYYQLVFCSFLPLFIEIKKSDPHGNNEEENQFF
jgi:hypothetical protein